MEPAFQQPDANVQSSMYFWSFSDTIGVSGRVPGVEIPLLTAITISIGSWGQMAYQTGSTTAKYPVYTTIFEFKPGLAIYDSRSVGRLCNIDSTHLPTIALNKSGNNGNDALSVRFDNLFKDSI